MKVKTGPRQSHSAQKKRLYGIFHSEKSAFSFLLFPPLLFWKDDKKTGVGKSGFCFQHKQLSLAWLLSSLGLKSLGGHCDQAPWRYLHLGWLGLPKKSSLNLRGEKALPSSKFYSTIAWPVIEAERWLEASENGSITREQKMRRREEKKENESALVQTNH